MEAKKPLEVTITHLIISGSSVIAAILGFWINTNVRLSVIETNVKVMQDRYTYDNDQTKEFRSVIGKKLDDLKDGQNEIKVSLEKKQDRK